MLTFTALFAANSANGSCDVQMEGRCSMYGRKKFSSTRMVTLDCPSVSGWKAVLNQRSVLRRENISSQNLLTNHGSQSEMITSSIPCSLNTWLTNKRAYSAAVISLVQGKKCTILVKRSTKTATVVLPSDYGKPVTRSVVICCQARSGRGIGCKAPAFFWLSDFIR